MRQGLFTQGLHQNSLGAQWVGSHLLKQGTPADPWSWRIPRAVQQRSWCAESLMPSPSRLCSTAWDATRARSPHTASGQTPVCSTQDPAQPRINKQTKWITSKKKKTSVSLQFQTGYWIQEMETCVKISGAKAKVSETEAWECWVDRYAGEYRGDPSTGALCFQHCGWMSHVLFIKGTGQVHTECERKSKIASLKQRDRFSLSIPSPLSPQNLIFWRS